MKKIFAWGFWFAMLSALSPIILLGFVYGWVSGAFVIGWQMASNVGKTIESWL